MATAIALPQFSFTDLLSYGWRVLQQHAFYLIKVVLIMIVLVIIPQILVDMLFEQSPALTGIFNLILTIWQMVLSLGILRIMLELLRTGKEPELSVDKFLEGKDILVKYIVGEILFGLLVMVGFILLIVPGFYFMLKYLFVPFLIADKKMDIKEAFAYSARMTEGKKLTLLFYILGFYLFILLGLLALFVGVFFTSAIAGLAWLGMYLVLEKQVSTKA